MSFVLAQGVTVAEWQTFPFGPFFTLSAMVGSVLFAAAMWKASEYFSTKKETLATRAELIETIDGYGKRLAKTENVCATTQHVADDNARAIKHLERQQGEQWRRISEEIIQPVREMSKELRETREMLVKNMQTQDSHGRDIVRIEKRLDGMGKS
jgi:hypothetical protein